MTLVAKINLFSKLCAGLNKQAQQSGAAKMVLEFAHKLTNFDLAQSPGVSLNIDALHQLGNELNTVAVSAKIPEMLKGLHKVLDLTQDGGGSLYSETKALIAKLEQAQPTWLDQYMTHEKAQKTPSWLDQYMTQENAASEADQDIAGMNDSIESGSSVKKTLNRSTIF